mgnify:CR=1 FL=1
MSVGKSSIRRAAGKTAAQINEAEVKGAAPELACACVAVAPEKTDKPAAKPTGKKPAAKKPVPAKAAENPVPVQESAPAPAAAGFAPTGTTEKVAVTEQMPYYLL